jgi:muramoyltetrapeptide carboxypeptidase
VAVIAPSGPFDRTLVFRGLGFLRQRYQVVFDRRIFERSGYLAGTDERRLAELDSRLQDPTLDAVITARGGYGLTRIAHRADFSALRSAPKWLVGFSDATVLHLEALGVGVASLHAHNVAGLGRGDEGTRAAFVAALEAPREKRVLSGLHSLQPGVAKGPLVAANLTLLFTAAAAGRLALPAGALLAIEDVTEQAYRVDRMLTALRNGGHLDAVAGVVAGEFTDCGPSHGVSVADVLQSCLGDLDVPVATGLGFGHGRHNAPLPVGLPATLDAIAGTLTLEGY